MKKKSLWLIIAVIIVLGVVACFFLFQKEETTGEKGTIEIKNNIISGVDKEAYEEISQYAWHGELNYRDIYLVFRPTDYDKDPLSGSKYECMIYEKDGEGYYDDSYYLVNLRRGKIKLDFVQGGLDFQLEGTYKDGILVLNETEMEKIDTASLTYQSYCYGNQNVN